jgi:hypothetical protein
MSNIRKTANKGVRKAEPDVVPALHRSQMPTAYGPGEPGQNLGQRQAKDDGEQGEDPVQVAHRGTAVMDLAATGHCALFAIRLSPRRWNREDPTS